MRRLNNNNMDINVKMNDVLFGMKCNIKNVLTNYDITISKWVSIILYTILQPFLRLRGCLGLSECNFPIAFFKTRVLLSMFRITFVPFYNPSRIEGLCWYSELQPGGPYLYSLDLSIA